MSIKFSWKKIKARKLLRENKISVYFENELRIHFTIKGDKDFHYVIYNKISNNFTCDCKWFSLKKQECSHILACRMFLNQLNYQTQ